LIIGDKQRVSYPFDLHIVDYRGPASRLVHRVVDYTGRVVDYIIHWQATEKQKLLGQTQSTIVIILVDL